MDRIDLFRTFVRVVECASFTRAAATMGLPRSSVSAAVTALENRVGSRLLHRTTRKVSPTQDGLTFYERCVALLSDVEEAEGLFRGSATKPSGRLRVDMPGRIGRLVVAPALPAFFGEYPDIDIDLGVTDRAVDLVEDNLDFVLRVGPLSDSGLVARQIGELLLVNVASADYLARLGAPRSPDDLQDHWAVNYASPSTGRIEPWEWMEGAELRSLPMRGRVTVNSAEAYIACCRAGLGMIQIPAYDVRDSVMSGDLVEVLPDHRAPPLPVNLLRSGRRHVTRRVRVFEDWLVELLKREVMDG